MIDAHAHLTDTRFADDLDAVMERARRAGVIRVLSAGEDVASSAAAIRLAERHAELRVAVGVHPHRAASWDSATAHQLRELALEEHVVAIGEIGIDLSGRSASVADQEAAFHEQLALAAELDLPVVIHVRDAGVKVREILAEHRPVRGMIHCYSEGAAELAAWLALGLHISFAGTVTYPTNGALRQAAAAVPAERLLAETDAPYLAPQNARGRRNEPVYVAATHALLSHERGEDIAELTVRIAANAAALFGARWGT